MRRLVLTAILAIAATPLQASIRVSPVLVQVQAPGKATTLTLKNDDAKPHNVQIRVFRWTQTEGEDRLDRTQDVVVSPPSISLAPGTEYVIRVVHVAQRPLQPDESYRVIVDEIPDRDAKLNGVRFALRYSVPIFFASAPADEARVQWTARQTGDTLSLSAHNRGARHLRLSNLRLVDPSGHVLVKQDGLVGYVLGGTDRRWTFRTNRRPKDLVRLLATSDLRPIDATVRLEAAR
jgi:fimbrial chaperone protein